MRVDKTSTALLGILSINDMTGYEIKKFIEGSIGFFWNESFGQIYPTLKKLEKVKLVSSKYLKDGKNKTIYKITKKGMQELESWLAEENSKAIIRDEFLLKLFFSRNLNKKILKKKLEKQKNDSLSDIQIYKSIEKNLKQKCTGNKDLMYWLFTLDFGISTSKMKLSWIKKIEKKLNF
jgi:DNA-binding PadR family transcriptional regulator